MNEIKVDFWDHIQIKRNKEEFISSILPIRIHNAKVDLKKYKKKSLLSDMKKHTSEVYYLQGLMDYLT